MCLLEENRQNGVVANKIVRWFQSEVVFKISNNLLVLCREGSSPKCKGKIQRTMSLEMWATALRIR